ncbi:MAG: Gfo/Idh/MocA family oxidoreductase [Bacteroidetes bacterium]|jgi:predicted dehydrogenase|nr:Gfo/Idh/MocA family oxidoreductase [Bacteroidota bacterium]
MKNKTPLSGVITRRTFIHQSAFLLGASALSAKRVIGANETVRVAIVGMGWWGASQHIRQFAKTSNSRVVALCDVDSERLQKAATDSAEFLDDQVTLESDYRRLLERKDIDAVVLATPNHWHALQTIWACQAGKDVYVEKPASHTVWEGEQMVKAARQYKRIVQVGLQNSSLDSLVELRDWLREGHIGEIQAIHGVWYNMRYPIGRRSEPLQPPDTVDYDLWLGPAQEQPIYRDRLHYDWHWDWNTGNGDLANLGSHIIDLVRKILGDPMADGEILSIGQRFAWSDAGDTPNMQLAGYKLAGVPVILEVNNHPVSPGRKAGPAFKGTRQGIIIMCQDGHFMGFGQGRVFDKAGNVIRDFRARKSHRQDFIDAVISRKETRLTAEMERGFESCKLPLLSNIAHRQGARATPDQIRAEIQDNPWLSDAFDRYQAQVERLGFNLSEEPWILGSGLNFDGKLRRFVGAGDAVATANQFLGKQPCRAPFDIPTVS